MENLRIIPVKKWSDGYGEGDKIGYNVYSVVRDWTVEELSEHNYSQSVIDKGVTIEIFNNEDNAKIFLNAIAPIKKSTQEVLNQYFTDGKQLYYQSSDSHNMVEGECMLRYQKTGKIELWFSGNNGEVCLLSTTDGNALESLIKALIN